MSEQLKERQILCTFLVEKYCSDCFYKIYYRKLNKAVVNGDCIEMNE